MKSAPSLLDQDLMAVLGGPVTSSASSQSTGFQQPQLQQQQQQQQQGFPTSSSYNSLPIANGNNNSNARLGGSGPMMPRQSSAPQASTSSSGMPVLQPPTRDTPSFRSSMSRNATNGAMTAAPGAMVVHGSLGSQQPQQQQQQPGVGMGAGSMMLQGAGGQGMGGGLPAGAQGNGGGFAGGQVLDVTYSILIPHLFFPVGRSIM